MDLVHSQDPEAARRLSQFQDGPADWLVSIDMCAEGFDAPRLRVVAYLTTVVTRSRFVQGITRAVRMGSDRAAVEAIPRDSSYIFAPADPLLMGYARSWSFSEPYRIRSEQAVAESEDAGAGSWRGRACPGSGRGAGATIRLRTQNYPTCSDSDISLQIVNFVANRRNGPCLAAWTHLGADHGRSP